MTTRPLRAEQILIEHGMSCYKGSFLRTLNCITSVSNPRHFSLTQAHFRSKETVGLSLYMNRLSRRIDSKPGTKAHCDIL